MKQCGKKTFHRVINTNLHCTENSKQIFPEMKLRGLLPNICIHVSVNDLYIPTIGPAIFLYCICGPIVGINSSQIHECRDWERGRAVSFLEIFVSNFRYSAFAVYFSSVLFHFEAGLAGHIRQLRHNTSRPLSY